MELLSPCGNKEALIAVIQNGCNAVYLAGKQFGARAFAPNFSDDELVEAINYAHMYDVSVYVTVNTIVFESEKKSLIEYLAFLYQNQVDAVIVQDFGVAQLVREQFPALPLHASTQMHIHNKEGAQVLKDAGFQRVVVARETPLDVLKEMISVGIEIEVFIHGALCVCYSGQCQMSRVIGGRSGNRGTCAQPCRLPYKLLKNEEIIITEGKYLLSPKDLCLAEEVLLLKKLGIHALKIEGRMKKPEYGAYITSFYRYLLDTKIVNSDIINTFLKNSSYLFWRGYTKGFLNNQYLEMSQVQPNHQGVILGNVQKQTKGRVTIALVDRLQMGDGIRFESTEDGFLVQRIYKGNQVVSEAQKGEIIELQYQNKVAINSQVIKTMNRELEKEIQQFYQREPRKVNISVLFKARVQQKAILQINCGNHFVEVKSDKIVELAEKNPTSIERIQEQLIKVGGTVYTIEKIKLDVDDNIFFSVSEINQMRREAISRLNRIRINRYQNRMIEQKPNGINEVIDFQLPYLVEVTTRKQFEICASMGIQNIAWQEVGANILAYSQVNEKSNYLESNQILVKEVGGLLKEASLKIGGLTMNIVNRESIAFLNQYGCNGFILSNELPKREKENLVMEARRTRSNLQLFEQIYGHQTLMISKHCVIRNACHTEKSACNLCHSSHFYLEDRKGVKYRIIGDSNCNMQLFSVSPIQQKQEETVCIPYFHFTIEDEFEMKEIIEKYKSVFFGNV